jgi:hypothetical protein
MENDKVFAAYATLLIAGISSVVLLALSSGIAAFPAAPFLLEHVALGLMIRGAYKGFDGESGFYVVVDAMRNFFEAGAIEASEMPAGAMHAAG